MLADRASIEPNHVGAQSCHNAHVVADEQHRPAVAAGDLVHLPQALLLKLGIADREHLVDDQDLRLQMRRDGEGQAHVHPGGIALDRRIEEPLDLGEGDDLVELAPDLGAASSRGSRR